MVWVAIANLILQSGVLVVLLWYTIETLQMRKAAEEQAEGVQKPCLTLLSEARDYEDAVLDMNDAVGAMIAAARDGNVAVQNVGNGPAISVRYAFVPINLPEGRNVARPRGYLQNLDVHGTFTMRLAREVLRNLEYRVELSCQSMTGQKYKSTITLRNLVLTEFDFARVDD